MELLRDFKEISKGDASLAGGKGASLGEMTRAGIPVPPGFVLLSEAFERFIEETDLNVEIDSILHKVNHQEIHTVDRASEEIQALILSAAMPKDIETEIEKHFKKLGAEFVAVRSSATAEDSSAAAWAGQLDTFLNMTEKTLLENVKRCWASLFTPRAIFYRFEKGLHKTKISVAVVVQKMVESEVSGIAFSVHPVTEDRNQLIIEAGFGLGEAIVSGQITPDSYVVEKNPRRIIDTNVSTQERKLVRASSSPLKKGALPSPAYAEASAGRSAGGMSKSSALADSGTSFKKGGIKESNEWVDIPSAIGGRQKLSEKQVLELSELILHIEKHYGFPCDIEWAFAEGEFYITQSRPITTLKSVSEAPAAVTVKKDGELWVNDFSVKVFSFQMTSAMMEFWPYVQRAILGKKAPLCFTKSFIDYEGTTMNGNYFLDTELTHFAEVLTELAFKNPEKVLKNHKESYRLNKIYFDSSWRCLRTKVSGMSDVALAKIYHDLTMTQETAHCHSLATTWYIDSHGATFSNALAKRTNYVVKTGGSKINPAEVWSTLTTPSRNSLAIEEEIQSLGIVRAIQKDKKAQKIFISLRQYDKIPAGISKSLVQTMGKHHEKWRWLPFGYRGPAYGLDYYLSTWAGLVRENVDAAGMIRLKKSRPAQIAKERSALFKKLKISPKMRKVYDVGADIIFLKGYRKYCCYLGMYTFDFLYKEIAKRLGATVADLHTLTYREITAMIRGEQKFDALEIARRKVRSFHWWDASSDSVSILSGEKAVDAFNSKHIKRDEIDIGAESFQGACASGGYAKGAVKIVNQVEDMMKMGYGDIMVSHTTFPSLVPAMKKAAAIVTEDGGVTCHAAIVARELKIPCLVGVKGATRIFKDGDEIEVDANGGIVRVIKR